MADSGATVMADEFLLGERYLKNPETVRKFIACLPIIDIPARYVIMKPLRDVDFTRDNVRSITFLVNPDQLSALVVLANHDGEHNENVIIPFAAGCHSIGICTFRENEREHPRAVVGLVDLSARKNLRRQLGRDVMSLSVTAQDVSADGGKRRRKFFRTRNLEEPVGVGEKTMQIMTILGSPRRQGNTAKVLGWIEGQFQAAGHAVDQANILDYSVEGCCECLACKKGTVELCSMDDGGNALFRRMVAADLVLIAAPVFCWGFPAQIKGLIDRMLCLMDFEDERPGAPRLHGKPMALLLTAGGEQADNGDLVIRGFEHLVEYLMARMAGHLFVAGCTTPEEMGDNVKARAIAFATMLSVQGK